eukprot:Selendium_serpulae@DN3561_c0_g1_i4.p1
MRAALQDKARRELDKPTFEWVLPGWEHVVENAATIDKTTSQLEEAPVAPAVVVHSRRSYGGFNPAVEKQKIAVTDRSESFRRASEDQYYDKQLSRGAKRRNQKV